MRNVLIILGVLWVVVGAQSLPEKPTAWCNDYAGVLTPAQRDTLNAILGDFERRTSNQIFIAIFRRLPENTYLEDFAVRLFEKWRPGLPDKNNGILIVIFTEDRKARIEVGYGLEDVITDAQARRVLYDQMIPFFKQGDYYRGLMAGLQVLMPAAEGKYQIPLKRKRGGGKQSQVIGALTFFLIFFVIFLLSRKQHVSMTLGPGQTIVWHAGGGYGRRRRRREDEDDDFWSGGSFGGGGFSGGFGGLSGGGGASGSW